MTALNFAIPITLQAKDAETTVDAGHIVFHMAPDLIRMIGESIAKALRDDGVKADIGVAFGIGGPGVGGYDGEPEGEDNAA